MKTSQFNISEYLDSPEMIAEYLDACMEEGGQELFLKALGDAVRAVGVATVTAKAGLGRTNAYKTFSPSGNPELSTISSVLDTMGMRLSVVPKEHHVA
jgi:probable addiction module antidote protein